MIKDDQRFFDEVLGKDDCAVPSVSGSYMFLNHV